jgi:glycosyltransferase involved in cell wall biosynthesis
MPRVSIIVPNFNHGRFLSRRLTSIFEQSIQDFELIFLDDASTDNSLEVFKVFANDSRVTLHVNKSNSGNPFVQWNKGLVLAVGQYIWIAESDDFAEPTFLEMMIASLEQHPTAGLATCRSMITDQHDQDLEIFDAYHWFGDRQRWKHDYFNSGLAEISDYLAFQNTIPNASATLLRHSLVESGLRAPENMTIAGDWFFWITLLSRADICHIGQPLNHFRQEHQSSQRVRSAADGKEVLEGFDVYNLVARTVILGNRNKLLAQMGLMRRWLSIASRYRIHFQAQSQIYHQFLGARFDSWVVKILQVLLASSVFLLIPLARLPGFRSLAMGCRNLLTRSVS